MRTVELHVTDPAGLHARPAALFVRAAGTFRARISITNISRPGRTADAKSMLAVLGLGVESGHTIRVDAEGEDEAAAIETLSGLVAGGSDGGRGTDAAADAASADAPAADADSPESHGPAGRSDMAGPTSSLTGIGAAPGSAVGVAWIAESSPPSRMRGTVKSGDLHAAAHSAADELEALGRQVRDAGHPDEAGILEAQATLATDPRLLADAEALIAGGTEAAPAILLAAERHAAVLGALADEILAARAADVSDVGARIARRLRGERLPLPSRPVVAIAHDLPPSTVAEIPSGLLLGICLEVGSRTAHAAILARSLGIPAVVGVAGVVGAVAGARRRRSLASDAVPGTDVDVAIDGDAGSVVIEPDEAMRTAVARRVAAGHARAGRAARLGTGPGRTADGEHVRLLANIGRPADASRALVAGAEGVGLFRTEFVFMGRTTAPTEDDQFDAYREVLTAFGPDRPVVIRLADIGGDKPLPYLDVPAETNPFLGVRAIRLAYSSRAMLLTQLRAIVRAGAAAHVRPHVMAPMVATLDDVRLLDSLVDEAVSAVSPDEAGPDRPSVGIMVEVPSAVLMAHELADRVAFFSIGTNDLTQYVMAADRTNAALDRLHDPLHPAVLRAIALVMAAATEGHIPVAVCGEAAAEPAGALILVGLGIRELSADAEALASIRLALSAVTMEELRRLGQGALRASDAASVRSLAGPLVARTGPTATAE